MRRLRRSLIWGRHASRTPWCCIPRTAETISSPSPENTVSAPLRARPWCWLTYAVLERTCFATSIAWLVRLPGSVRALASPSDLLSEERSVNAPREIMRLVNWLMSNATETVRPTGSEPSLPRRRRWARSRVVYSALGRAIHNERRCRAHEADTRGPAFPARNSHIALTWPGCSALTRGRSSA